MTAVSETTKLAELRAKTDRELARIVANALELGVQCASATGTQAGPLRDKAADLYANATMLLCKVEKLSERRRLERKSAQLRALLDRPAMARPASCSAF